MKMMKSHFAAFAGYNRWANRRIYDAAAALTDADYRADRGAFFGSVHRTLNHLLVADRTWLKRITGEGDPPVPLDTILLDEFPALRSAREKEDARLIVVVDGMDDGRLAADLTYRNYQGLQFAQPMHEILSHVFNHQTHHRGQVHGILTGFGRESPVLDLAVYLRDYAANDQSASL